MILSDTEVVRNSANPVNKTIQEPEFKIAVKMLKIMIKVREASICAGFQKEGRNKSLLRHQSSDDPQSVIY